MFDTLTLDEVPDPVDPTQSAGLLAIYADSDRSALISEAARTTAVWTWTWTHSSVMVSVPQTHLRRRLSLSVRWASSPEARYRGRRPCRSYTPTITTGTYEFVISIGGEVRRSTLRS